MADYTITLTTQTVPCPPEHVYRYNHAMHLLAGLARKQLAQDGHLKPVAPKPEPLHLSIHSPSIPGLPDL